ncbi:MAG: type II toxin-antitoxin system CcdA family antitoxin, partial [Stellaceae bacterium]
YFRAAFATIQHMESTHFDHRARKRTVSLTLNGDLYAKAKAAGINASRVAETALAEALKTRRAEILSAEIRQDREALARYVAEHGDPAAELREMFAPPDAA